MYDSGIDEGLSFAKLAAASDVGSQLTQLLMAEDLVPGDAPSYELCKTIHAYHPLGAILTNAPVTRAQSKKREISVPLLGEERLIEQFDLVAGTLGKIGLDVIVHNIMVSSRIYGISSIGVGEIGKDPSTPMDVNEIADADLFFNVFDPLNTAGSLVMNQNPNEPDFMKPKPVVHVSGQKWHPSRLYVKQNEESLYIEWSPSAFGFSGRSVYQRPLYPLKTYLRRLITTDLVLQKAGLIVAKMDTPGSIMDNIMTVAMFWKRKQIKSGATGNVLSIGVNEAIETLNMMNLEGPFRLACENNLKDIASACSMPVSIIAQELLATGLADGTEDAKKEASYLDYVRTDMNPIYAFLDPIVMRKAWTEEFYETLKVDYPEYKRIPYTTALAKWMRSFKATWPNLLEEPDSEKSKMADVQLKAVVAVLESVGPMLDAQNKANLVEWVAANVNERHELFAGILDINVDALASHLEEQAEMMTMPAEETEEPREPRAFSAAS